jgi:hypothetical protein
LEFLTEEGITVYRAYPSRWTPVYLDSKPTWFFLRGVTKQNIILSYMLYME